MPLMSKLHKPQILNQVSVKYRNEQYLHAEAFAPIPVLKTSDYVRQYVRDFRIPETSRADKAKSREFDFDVTHTTYILEKHALRTVITKDEQDNYDAENLKVAATEELTDKLMMRAEKSFYDLMTDTSWSLGQSLAANNAWNDTTTANPIVHYDTAGSVIVRNSGKKPNFSIVNRNGFVAAKNNSNVLDRVKYTSANITESMLAALFSVEKFMVSNIGFDQAGLGLPDSITAMWPNYAFIGFKTPSPGPRNASCGYMFQKQKELVKEWIDEELDDATVVEVNKQYQFKIVASLTGYLIKNVAS